MTQWYLMVQQNGGPFTLAWMDQKRCHRRCAWAGASRRKWELLFVAVRRFLIAGASLVDARFWKAHPEFHVLVIVLLFRAYGSPQTNHLHLKCGVRKTGETVWRRTLQDKTWVSLQRVGNLFHSWRWHGPIYPGFLLLPEAAKQVLFARFGK